MTTLSSQQSFQFRVTGVTGSSFQGQTEQNVRKRIEKILYLETPPDDAVLLSYVGSTELSPDTNLFIGDRSDTLYANSRTGKVQEFIGSVQPVYVKNSNFLVTQVFNEAESGDIPLYYKHVLPLTIVAESVRIYDKNFDPVSVDKYKLVVQQEYDENTGLPQLDGLNNPIYTEYHLYNDLESSYNRVTGEYTVYFIQYTITSGTTDLTVTELLSNELAYREATFEDIWSLTLDLKPWTQAYLWNSTSMSLVLPESNNYSIRYEESKRISVKSPVAIDDVHPWFPRVINTKVVTNYGSASTVYSIPEFETQAFNPLEPYKVAVRQLCRKIDDHLVKLPHEDLQSGTLFSYFYMVFEYNDTVVYAVTNDPYSAGTEYRNFDYQTVLDSDGNTILWSSDQLLGLDSLAGIVHVSFDIDDDYEILATYSYKERYYEVTTINMNPIFDQLAHNEIRALYIVPTTPANGNEGIQTESIRWVRVSPSGKIIATNQNGDGNNENLDLDIALTSAAGYKLQGIIGMHYNWRATCTLSGRQEIIFSQELSVNSTEGFPRSGWIRFEEESTGVIRYAKFVDKTDTILVLSSNQDDMAYEATGLFVADGTTIELVNFVDERTTLSNRAYQYETEHVSSGLYPSVYSRYFLLAEMSVNPPHSHQDAVRIDVRKDGGGIDTDKYEEAKLQNPQIQWVSNFGNYNGQIYPGNAVIVVKLPVSILNEFTELEIKRIVEMNVPLGVKPLIRYYGYQPNVTFVGPEEINTYALSRLGE